MGELGGGSEEVCVLCIRPKGAAGSEEAVIATGLQNGAIKLWELPKQTMTITLRFVRGFHTRLPSEI